jgi:hypothetical protein
VDFIGSLDAMEKEMLPLLDIQPWPSST